MLFNIKTGYNPTVIKRANPEIVFLVSSLHKLAELGITFVFTNGHAALEETEYFEDLDDLDRVDWPLLQARDFKKDPDDPGKLGRYQAEALVHQHVPIEALIGVACYDGAGANVIEREVKRRGLSLQVKAIPDWYFR